MAVLLATHTLIKIANDYFVGGGGFLYPSLFQRVQGSAFICVFAFHSDFFFIYAFADAPKNVCCCFRPHGRQVTLDFFH